VSDTHAVDIRSEQDARALVLEIVGELAPTPAQVEGDGVKLVDDLEYTSLALLELAFTLEDEFELPPIDEETARGIATVRDIQDHVVEALRAEQRLAA
jgi:acyl carrier protein